MKVGQLSHYLPVLLLPLGVPPTPAPARSTQSLSQPTSRSISEPTFSTPNPMGGHPTHLSTSGGLHPQKATTDVHPGVPTGTLVQPDGTPPPRFIQIPPPPPGGGTVTWPKNKKTPKNITSIKNTRRQRKSPRFFFVLHWGTVIWYPPPSSRGDWPDIRGGITRGAGGTCPGPWAMQRLCPEC